MKYVVWIISVIGFEPNSWRDNPTDGMILFDACPPVSHREAEGVARGFNEEAIRSNMYTNTWAVVSQELNLQQGQTIQIHSYAECN